MFANVITSEFDRPVGPVTLRGTAPTLEELLARDSYSPTPIQKKPLSSLTKQVCPVRKVTNEDTGEADDCYAVKVS